MTFPTYKAAKNSLREFSKESGLREAHDIVTVVRDDGSKFYCRVLTVAKVK